MAPPTVKRTPLEEHSGPNTWAVVSRIFHYVKNGSDRIFDPIFMASLIV